MIYVGMDVHRQTTTYCAIDDAGAVVAKATVPSGEDGWVSIVDRHRAGGVRVVLETGATTFWAVEVLRGAGVEPVVVDARRFRLIAESRKKSDARDARTLAEALKGGLADQCSIVMPSERARKGRALIQARATVIRQCTAARNAALGLLRSIGLSLTGAAFKSSARWESLLQSPRIPEWMRSVLRVHRELWESASRARLDMDAEVSAVLEEWPEAKVVDAIPGFGPVVTLAVVSSLDDAKRFHRSKQAASYAGMVPSVRASGDSVHLGRVTKQGRSALRSLLVQAGQVAFRAKKLTPGLRAWAMRLLFRRGRKIAAIALGRRLFELAHKLLVRGGSYDPNFRRVAA